MSYPPITLTNQNDLTGSIFWLVYIVAIVLSIVGVFISSKLRHDREVGKFWKKVRVARRDASSAWPVQDEGEQ